MIAEHDPFGIISAGKTRDDVVDFSLLIIHHDFQMNGGLAGAGVIGDWQAALPGARDFCAGEMREDRGGILRVDGHHGNARKAARVGGRNALRVGSGRDARRERIAGIDFSVEDRAALDGAHRPPRAARVNVAGIVAVIGRIGINQQRGGFVFFGKFRLDAAISVAVTHENDFSRDAGAERFELAVIVGRAVIGVNDGRRDFTGRRVSIEADRGAGIVRALVPFVGLFLRGEGFFLRSDEIEFNFGG